jgi:hypothetical protein
VRRGQSPPRERFSVWISSAVDVGGSFSSRSWELMSWETRSLKSLLVPVWLGRALLAPSQSVNGGLEGVAGYL